MRIVALLPCLLLTGCLTGLKSEPDFPSQARTEASAAPASASAAGSAAAAPLPAPPPAAAAAPSPRAAGTRGGGGAASGGATTAARAPAPASRSADPDEPVDERDPLTRARADCWMKVEREKIRDIDKRTTFVDKCVAQAMKGDDEPEPPTAAPRRRAPR